MSICLDNTSTVLANQVSTTAPQATNELSTPSTTVPSQTASIIAPIISSTEQNGSNSEQSQQQSQTIQQVRAVPKLPSTTNTALSKASLITVLNTPLGNVKTLCVTPAVSSNASGQFTVVNSAPLNASNSTVVKSQTITLINTPVTVVKTISSNIEKSVANDNIPNNANVVSASVPALIENRGHNVFVKNTTSGSDNVLTVTTTVPTSGQEIIPQSHKLLTANNFPTNNLLTTTINQAEINPPKTANGQRNKVKILSNIIMPGPSQNTSNIILNKNNSVNPTSHRYVSRQKVIGPNNGTTTKYVNKSHNIINKSNINPIIKQQQQQQAPQKIVYPTHKSHIKTIPPVNNYLHVKPHGIKTLSPHTKGMPGQIQRAGSGLRTIPPQRSQKIPNKPNYIGKHAVQAQKLKQSHKLKGLKSNQMYNNYHNSMIVQEKSPLTFNQALTAEILETLSNSKSNSNSYSNKSYEILSSRYENTGYYSTDVKPSFSSEATKSIQEDKHKSGLDTLSLICQAVLLDHNYNATLPPDSPTRTLPTQNNSQINGVSVNNLYSPTTGKRRTLSSSSNIPSSHSISNISSIPNNNSIAVQEDDAASDISDGSDRKHDTEGEETDTAPEAEAVNNEDQFGDYVTRCICGFLHDDGYMIECDHCKVWQHVQCVVKNKQVPEEYLCEVCDPHKHIDRPKARMAQQQWLRDRQFLDPKLRKDTKLKEAFKPKEALSDSDSSDSEQTGLNNVITKGRATLVNRRKGEQHARTTNARQRREAAKEVGHRRQIKKREKKIVKRKTKAQVKSHSDEEHHDISSGHLPQLRQWIENYEEAVTNHYSPELRARISSIRVNGAHSDISTEYDSSVHKCRVHTQPLTEIKYLVSTVHLPPNTPVIELRGKYMLSTQQIKSGGNLNTRQHSQRPGPFLFFYRLYKDNTEVCVDTRTYGNSARFIRRSCKPNAELRHCIVKGVLHLYIVTIASVDKNVELTIKHESHDLAVIGTTHIACACGNLEECTVNKTATVKKNGDTTETHKKRRGRRTASLSAATTITEEATKNKNQKELPTPLVSPTSPIKVEEPEEKVELPPPVIKVEEEDIKPCIKEQPVEEVVDEQKFDVKDIKTEEEDEEKPSGAAQLITTRRSSSQCKVEKEEVKDGDNKEGDNKNKKLSREERKLEAILRAIAQMEKADQRKQEHQAKQAHRRESEPGLVKEDEKSEPRIKRKRRKGRARTTSTSASSRRNRLNSTDSYLTSGDETILSPHEHPPPTRPSLKNNLDGCKDGDSNDQNCSNRDAGLLLALSNGDKTNKSPARELDSNSNSAQSSPETHLSSACLLVQAAVEPMEAGFKFPKTKKGLMNEWLNKAPETVQSSNIISPSLTSHISASDYDTNTNFYTTPGKTFTTLCDVNQHTRGNAKKRWLRQAISEDQCDSPSGRPDSPPLSDTVAPPKKRRLPRESLSNDNTPPSTPTSTVPVGKNNERQSVQDGFVEIVYSAVDDDSPSQILESEAVLEERAAEMKEEFSKCLLPPVSQHLEETRSDMPSVGCLMDPRLSRDHHMFSNSEHLVGTVEKTLSILGFEDRRPEPITPAKRKLSITEYRQRKKLNVSDKSTDEPDREPASTEENNSSESFKPLRTRSNSSSSCTSISSSDEEIAPSLELTGKAPSAFNSEPTELERQREMTSLRLKKAFGIAIDEEARKPALNVEAILNCELPSVMKTIPPSPTFPIPGSCEVTLASSKTVDSNVVLDPTDSSTLSRKSPERDSQHLQLSELQSTTPLEKEIKEANKTDAGADDGTVQPNLFYTPDEEERVVEESVEGRFDEMDAAVDYVPPFNNPIYPNDSNFTSYASVIDEDGRYEGRNPSPPPDLEPSTNESFSSHQT